MNPADVDVIIWWIYALGLFGILELVYQVIAAIARRQVRKELRGYTMMRTVQPRDGKGRYKKA